MELPRSLKIVIGIFTFILVANLVLLDYFFVLQRSDLLDFQARLTQIASRDSPAPITTTIIQQQAATPSGIFDLSCPKSCLPLIDSAVKTASVPKTTTVTPTAVVDSPRSEQFIPLGSGSVLNTESSSSNWKTIETAQATFDAVNFGSIKAAYFEVFINSGTAGETHARLFDSTSPAILWGSEVSTGSTSTVFLSAPISLSAGNKTYKVQMYSTISTGSLSQSRIRIVTQ